MLGAILGLVATLQAKAQKARTSYIGSFSTTSTALVTAISVSGSGKIDWLLLSASANYNHFQLYIDGNLIFDGSGANYSSGYIGIWGITSNNYGGSFTTDLLFNSSFSVNIANTGGATSTLQFAYELDQ